MIFKYIAGNKYNHAINTSKKIMNINKNNIPVINYAIENNKKIDMSIYKEYENLSNNLNENYRIALKLSSFNFDENILNDIIDIYSSKNIKILIDAEDNSLYDNYNNTINKLITDYNHTNCNIYKTYQMYRKDSLSELLNDIDNFDKSNIHLGIKLVRGAYWNSEKNYNHLFMKKYDSDMNYDNAISYLYDYYHKNISCILATHNTTSIEYGLFYNSIIENNHQKFEFGKLLGMKNNVYNNILNNKINVYIPYGPYHKMIPYLSRRLYENIDTFKHL